MKKYFLAIFLTFFFITPAVAQPRTVTGAFLQLNATNSKAGQAYWNRQIVGMKKLGMDTAIIQYVAYDRFYHYPTKIKGMVPAKDDVIMQILNAARERKLKIFLGLQMDGSFWKQKFDLQKRISLNIATMNELHQRYGSHAALGGWYIPEEIDNETASRDYEQELLDYLARLTARAREFPKLPVMISPFFSKNVTPHIYAKWWDEKVLPQIKIDIVALQDGVGTHRVSLSDIKPVYSELAPVMKRHGVQFWANIEAFDQTAGWPINDNPWAAKPVSFQRFIRQENITAPFTSKTILFEYTQYMDPVSSLRAKLLFNAYEQRVGQK